MNPIDEMNNSIMELDKTNKKLRTAYLYNSKMFKNAVLSLIVVLLSNATANCISNERVKIGLNSFAVAYSFGALFAVWWLSDKKKAKLAEIDKKYEDLQDEYQKRVDAANDNFPFDEGEDDGIVVITVKVGPYHNEKDAADMTPLVKAAYENMPADIIPIVNRAAADMPVAILKKDKSKQYMANAHRMKSQQIARNKLMNKHYLASKKKQQMFIARQGRRK